MGAFAAKDAGVVSHKIQQHETLFRISLMYNSTVGDIQKANPGVDAKHIRYGAVIKVPRDTKMRDPEFVASFLNESHYNESPIEQVASKITVTTERSTPVERPRQVSMPAQQPAPKMDIRQEKPANGAKADPAKPTEDPGSAAQKPAIAPASSSNFNSDENPFITPSDPKPSAAAEEQHAKANESSAKDADTEDENPFVTPKQKAEDAKDAGKTSSND